MSRVSGGITVASTGNNIAITGFGINPKRLNFRTTAKNGTSSNVRVYLGSVDDSGYQGCDSVFDDETHVESKTLTANTRCILIREYTGGAWHTAVEASFSGYITDGFELDVTSSDSTYSIWVDAED